jgi:hypothetical protein
MTKARVVSLCTIVLPQTALTGYHLGGGLM